MTLDPEFVTTMDGARWERRAETADGRGLYALAGACTCPPFVMATLAELAVHGIRPTDPAPALAPAPAPEANASAARPEAEELAERVAALEALRARLLDLLPRDACMTQGLPNVVDAARAEYGAWELVAEVLGVTLPYTVPGDEQPVPYEVTEDGEHVVVEAASERLRAFLAPSAAGGGQ